MRAFSRPLSPPLAPSAYRKRRFTVWEKLVLFFALFASVACEPTAVALSEPEVRLPRNKPGPSTLTGAPPPLPRPPLWG